MRATEQLSVVVEQRSGPSARSEKGDTGDGTESIKADGKDVPDLPKKLLLEATMQMRVPTSSPTQPPTHRVGNGSKIRDCVDAIECAEDIVEVKPMATAEGVALLTTKLKR